MSWWQWLDFEDRLKAQVWAISVVQCLLLAVSGVILYGLRP